MDGLFHGKPIWLFNTSFPRLGRCGCAPRTLCKSSGSKTLDDLGSVGGLTGRMEKKTSFKMGRTHIKRCYTHDKLDISYIIIYNIDDKLDI